VVVWSCGGRRCVFGGIGVEGDMLQFVACLYNIWKRGVSNDEKKGGVADLSWENWGGAIDVIDA